MTLERWIDAQVGKGNKAGVAMGRTLLGLYGDILPGTSDEGVLPAQVQAETIETPRDLRQETYELLANLREPTSKERKAFKKRGFVFLTVDAKSLGQICEEEAGYFGFINSSQGLRTYTPPQAFEIAVNPKKLRIPRSNNSSQDKQLRLTKEHSQKEIEPISAGARAVMLPATAIAQADVEYQKQNSEVLLPDFWVRALDTTVGPDVASVGRDRPSDRLRVSDWGRGHGLPSVWALSAVVFVKN